MLARAKALALTVVLGAVVLTACDEPQPIEPPDNGGGGGGGLTLTSTDPAAGSTTANFSGPVTAVFDHALNSSTVTVTTVSLVSQPGNVDVPRTVLVTGGGNTILESAALLPGTEYTATLAPSIQSTLGSTLGTAATWTFRTRPFTSFPLDSGRTGYAGRLGLARDNTGALHAVFADSVQGDLFYATCAAACAIPGSWSVLAVDTWGNIGSSSAIAVDGNRRVSIIYRDDQNTRLRYATCTAPCSQLTNFRFATVDASSIGVGLAPSLAVDSNNNLHAIYYDFINAYIRYATCTAADCALDASWASGILDPGPFVGRTNTIITQDNQLHAVYSDSVGGRLRYATCAVSCTQVGAWAIGDISLTEFGRDPSMAIAPNGTLSVSYFIGVTADMGYAECISNCLLSTNWNTTALQTAGIVGRGSTLSVNAQNRRQIIFADSTASVLRYGTCVNTCTSASRWRFASVQDNVGLVRFPAAVVRPDNSLQVLYLAWGGTAIRFAE